VTIYADLLRYRELFSNLFGRELRARYKGSFLGVTWSLANPIVLMGIYVLVFSLLWKVVDIEHYALFLLCGLAIWVLFSSALTAASRSLVESADLVKKVRFPRQLVPLAVVAAQLVPFAVMLGALIVVDAILLPRTRDTVLLAIPIGALAVLLVAGVSLAVASANVIFRDVEHLVSALMLPLFFLTPILYRLEDLPGGLERYDWVIEVLRWANFLSPAIYALRDPLFYGVLPAWTDVLYLCGAAVVALALGAWTFSRVDDRIAAEL
jgi:lipopolysaccharide transport system permease protein